MTSSGEPRSSQRASTTFCWLPPESVADRLHRVVARADRELLVPAPVGVRLGPARDQELERARAAATTARATFSATGRTAKIASRLPVGRDEADAARDRLRRALGRRRLAGDAQLAGVELAQAEDRLGDLRRAGAELAVERRRSRPGQTRQVDVRRTPRARARVAELERRLGRRAPTSAPGGRLTSPADRPIIASTSARRSKSFVSPSAATEPSRSTCTRSEIACTSSSRWVM